MIFETILFLAVVFFLLHYWSFGYWARRNVFTATGESIFGNIKDIIFKKKSLIAVLDDIYMNHKSQRIIGIYALCKPMLLLADTELIKYVLVRDFNSFYDNGFCLDVKVDPMFGINPFCLKGLEQWKAARGIQVPMQTTFRLKEMVSHIIKVGQLMNTYILKNCSKPLEVKEVTSMYTIDNVASCAFGLEPSAFIDPENGFKKHATTSLFDDAFLSNFAAVFFPKIGKIFSLRIVTKDAQDFFLEMVRKNISFRKKSNTFRNDLIDNLIKLNKKKVEDHQPEFSDLELAGHCMTFYLDGYETSSSALSFLLLELANASEIQERLRKEIMSVGTEYEQFDFDKVQSISYLTMVLNESLRKHPLLPVLSRMCTKDIVLGDVKISKGTKVFIPVASLHKDPDFFPEPEKFNPERFSDENRNSIVPFSYLPFGDGPRTCVGSKFALLQIKMAVIFILLKFRIYPEDGTRNKEIQYDDTSAFVIVPKNGTKLRFDPLL